jgi:hypothetical protein
VPYPKCERPPRRPSVVDGPKEVRSAANFSSFDKLDLKARQARCGLAPVMTRTIGRIALAEMRGSARLRKAGLGRGRAPTVLAGTPRSSP